MSKKTTVTILVPAYNEEKNIRQLLSALLVQKTEDFVVENIIVVSDGSTDNTVRYVHDIKDDRISVIDSSKRLGKVKRLNESYRKNKSDILAQFDADVLPKDENTLANLIEPFQSDKALSIVYGNPVPVMPSTYVGRLVRFGYYVWEEAKQMIPNPERYNSSGTIMAFSKRFLQTYKIPDEEYITEDTYSFYYAKSKGLKTYFQRDAIVYIKLAQTYNEYVNQMNRYMTTNFDMPAIFGRELTDKYETITESIKLKALMKYMRTQPVHISISYLFIHVFPRVRSRFFRQKKLWDLVKTSK